MSTRILGVFSFNDENEDSIVEAYCRALIVIKRLWKGNLASVKNDPKCPFRLRSNLPIEGADWRKIRLYDREGMIDAL